MHHLNSQYFVYSELLLQKEHLYNESILPSKYLKKFVLLNRQRVIYITELTKQQKKKQIIESEILLQQFQSGNTGARAYVSFKSLNEVCLYRFEEVRYIFKAFKSK
ncbi:Hypothetical_protein [Hexamita inflata]|uniref:Hypothetical_protein n=1 Tax=Hexamita inflata TaxID=28002 RepID=A0AA86NGT1_9EUKA|nr:Hypothetical protein HINF_LOCUS7060 [Hexamita inflata]